MCVSSTVPQAAAVLSPMALLRWICHLAFVRKYTVLIGVITYMYVTMIFSLSLLPLPHFSNLRNSREHLSNLKSIQLKPAVYVYETLL
ncbi:hypothetical protein BJV78DRAFT_1171982, partial [Lactifluus subvellereus]